MRGVKFLTVVLVVILAGDAFCQQRSDIYVRHLSLPEYPPLARQARQQGDVTAKVTLDERGQLVSVSEIKGPQFLRSAIEAVRDWMFIVPDKVPTSFLLTFRFKLVGEEHQYPHCQFKAELPELVEITCKFVKGRVGLIGMGLGSEAIAQVGVGPTSVPGQMSIKAMLQPQSRKYWPCAESKECVGEAKQPMV